VYSAADSCRSAWCAVSFAPEGGCLSEACDCSTGIFCSGEGGGDEGRDAERRKEKV
jgi:hypothetical protein